jgi:hypothetical protein
MNRPARSCLLLLNIALFIAAAGCTGLVPGSAATGVSGSNSGIGSTGNGSNLSVSISPSAATLRIGQTQQFSTSVANASGSSLQWAANGVPGGNLSVGTISKTGLYTAPGMVLSGPVSITATNMANPSQTGQANVGVIGYTGVLRYRNDPGNTGQNPNETTLTPANVNATQFGKLFCYVLDGQSYTQPLYVSNVVLPGEGTHNLIFAATEHDTVYAFDADTNLTLWAVNFTNPAAGVTTVPSSDLAASVGGPPMSPEIGITGTPAIDGNSGTLYVVAATKENGIYVHRLHALDITTGQEKFGGPILIQASTPGAGEQAAFSSEFQLQRPALVLLNGLLYICFGSYSDWIPYHGWVMAYDAYSLKQVAVWNASPNGVQAGIWQGGAPLSVDSAGNLYASVANGTFDVNTGGSDYGDSFVKLAPKTLAVVDYFTPFNQAALDDPNIDIGSGGFTLLPDQPGPFPHLGVSAGKEGRIYLLNLDDLGKFHADSDSQIVQSIPDALGADTLSNGKNFSTPAYWQGNIYFIGNKDVIKQFKLTNGVLSSSPVAMGSQAYGYPGGNMSISANGSQNGIVWAIEAGGANVLHAYDATNVARELYNSNQAGSRDQFGNVVRFAAPTVVNGKVYVAGQTQLAVFGLF